MILDLLASLVYRRPAGWDVVLTLPWEGSYVPVQTWSNRAKRMVDLGAWW